jgi:hypothetical protein
LSETKRLSIYGRVEDGTLFRLGWADLPVETSPADLGSTIGTLLHKMAWFYEETNQALMLNVDAGVEDSGGNRATPAPRMASYMGLVFWEVAPDEFVLATTWDEALRLYGNVTQYDAKQVKKMYPAAIWENL